MGRRSIVVQTSVVSGLLCAGVSVFIFGIVFEMQQSIAERRLTQDAAAELALILAEPPPAGAPAPPWTQLAGRVRATPNVLYSYLLAGGVLVGAERLAGEVPPPWEPRLPGPAGARAAAAFSATAELVRAFPAEVRPYERLTLLAVPWCPPDPGGCRELRAVVSLRALEPLLDRLRVGLVASALLIPLATWILVHLTIRRYLLPLADVSRRMRLLAAKSLELGVAPAAGLGDEGWVPASEPLETRAFKESLQSFAAAFEHTARIKGELAVNRQTAELARQVAHDIRSPLAALEAVLAGAGVMPKTQQQAIRSAISRIQGIATALLAAHLDADAPPPGGRGPRPAPGKAAAAADEPYLLGEVLAKAVAEKRLQFAAHAGLTLSAPSVGDAWGIYAAVARTELERVLSNLLNNGVEALTGPGALSCTVRREAGVAELGIRDSGRGIPPEILPKVFGREFTHAKVGGTGLGLFHARSTVEGWGGRVRIESTVGVGTVVHLSLPLAAAPAWHVPELLLGTGSTWVVVDDDPTVHALWQERFAALPLAALGVVVRNFLDLDAYRGWYGATPDQKACRMLMDLEFSAAGADGLEAVVRLGAAAQTVLVTGHAVDGALAGRCLAAGLRLVPKAHAAFVPLRTVPFPEATQAVLVDDDVWTRQAWAEAGAAAGVPIATFATPAELLAVLHRVPLAMPLFLDAHLGSERGEDLARTLSLLGYRELYLATGYEAAHLGPLPWIRAVIGKTPPAWLFPSQA